MSDPYKQTKVNGKKYRLHRWLVEQHLGRPLLKTDLVHQKNGNKRDNRLENLEIVSPAQHGLEHTRHAITKPCGVCGRVFMPEKTKRKRQQTCGLACKRKLLSIRVNEAKAAKHSKDWQVSDEKEANT
jgi:hypothetical protein